MGRLRNLISLFAIACIHMAHCQEFEVKYHCHKGDLTVEAKGLNGVTLAGIQAPNKAATCSDTATGTGSVIFTIASGVATGTIGIAAASQTACGYSASSSDANIFKVTLVLMKNAKLIDKDDSVVSLQCDKTAITEKTVATASAFTPSGTPISTVIGKDLITAQLDVISGTTAADLNAVKGATALTSGALGTDIFLRLKVSLKNPVTKAMMVGCTFETVGGIGLKASVIGTDGCPVIGDKTKTPAAYIEPGFAYLTQPTKVFKPRDISPINVAFTIKCNVKYCATNAECTLPTVCPIPVTRRRRNADNFTSNIHQVSTTFLINADQPNRHGAQIEQCGHSSATFRTCMANAGFTTMMITLILLLILSITVSVFFSYKLIRAQSATSDKQAFTNYAHKG